MGRIHFLNMFWYQINISGRVGTLCTLIGLFYVSGVMWTTYNNIYIRMCISETNLGKCIFIYQPIQSKQKNFLRERNIHFYISIKCIANVLYTRCKQKIIIIHVRTITHQACGPDCLAYHRRRLERIANVLHILFLPDEHLNDR